MYLWWTSGNNVEDANLIENKDGTMTITSLTATKDANYGEATIIALLSLSMYGAIYLIWPQHLLHVHFSSLLVMKIATI